MRTSERPLRSIAAMALVCGIALTIGAAVAPARSEPSATKPHTQAVTAAGPQGSGEYVGAAVCTTCHEDQANAYKATPHGRQNLERSPAAAKGCETCHGPGKGHVEGGKDGGVDKNKIINFKLLMPQQASEICLTCHSNHSYKGEKQIKTATQPELCATCHRNIVNKQSRFNHMPVREGKLVCTNCHNPHGSANVKLLKVGTTIDEACTGCHSEKRGPYLWEHAPVVNACVTCHDPHGSNNERLLVAKVPFLCQRCHVTSRHPPTVYDGFVLRNSASANRLIGQGCVVCHVQIHGSNAPSGKYFHR